MRKPQWMRGLTQRRLFWVAAGAFASTTATLSAQAYVAMSRSSSDMLVIEATSGNQETMTKIIAAFGTCIGKFELEPLGHAYRVKVPTKNLRREDYECLLKAGRMGELVRREYLPPSGEMVWQEASWGIAGHE